MLNPVETVREWSFLTNPRTPKSVSGGVQHVTLDLRAAAGVEMTRLEAMRSAKVRIPMRVPTDA